MTDLKELQDLAHLVIELARKEYDAEHCDMDNVTFEQAAISLAKAVLRKPPVTREG